MNISNYWSIHVQTLILDQLVLNTFLTNIRVYKLLNLCKYYLFCNNKGVKTPPCHSGQEWQSPGFAVPNTDVLSTVLQCTND